MSYRISFSDGIGITGIVLAVILVVLDKAGKLKGGWLPVLLMLAGVMTLFLALGNSWVLDAPAKWKIWRGCLMFAAVALPYSGVAIWVSDGPSETGESPQPPRLVENLRTTDAISVKVEKTVPISEGPRVLLEYSWRAGQADDGLTLLNDGTEAALNLQFSDVQRGNWRVKFPPIAILKKGQRIKIRPIELVELSAPEYTRPYKKRNPTFALFLQRLSKDRAVPSSVDPVDVTVNISYQSASKNDNLRSLYVIDYSRGERLAKSKFLACGKAEIVSQQ